MNEYTVCAATVRQLNGLVAERDAMREQIAGLVAERDALRTELEIGIECIIKLQAELLAWCKLGLGLAE